MDTPKDLHIQKASHMSVPVDANVEVHMRLSEMPDPKNPGKVGDHVIIGVPSIITSIDKDSVRFKQESKFIIGPNPTPDPEDLLEGLNS